LIEDNVNRLNKLELDLKSKTKNYEKLEFSKLELEQRFKELSLEEKRLQDELALIGEGSEQKWKIQAEFAEKREKINKDIREKENQVVKIREEIDNIGRYIQAERNLSSKTKEFEKAMEKSKADLDELFENEIKKNFEGQVEILSSQLDGEFQTMKSNFQKIDNETTKLQKEFERLSMTVKFNEKNITEKTRRISEVGIPMENIKSERTMTSSELQEKRAELGQQKGCFFLYSKWGKDIEEKHACPLCERSCEKLEQVKLLDKIKQMNKDLPDEIEILEKRIEQLSKKEEKLLRIIPLLEEVENLKVKVVTDKEELIKKEEVKKVKDKEWEAAKLDLEKVQTKKQKAKEMLGHANNLDRMLKEIKEAESVFMIQKNKLGDDEIDKEELRKKKDDLKWQIEGLEEEINSLKDDLENIKEPESQDSHKRNEISKKLSAVKKEKEETNNEIKKTEGFLKGIKEDLKERKKEIQKSGSDTIKSLRDKTAERLIKEQIIKDLDIFAKSLDDAIIEYHKQKMESINMILEEHWPYVYRGTDIETIKIRSDPISSDKKKSYDYKVVMVIDGKELEMRDRCSAGQKVLASILIRVALADVFATGCPILALDEPTTNLDRDKVENVAEMLENLLRLRENNLQLIVITHDTDFVSRLYRACSPEYYYGLSKDEYGVSMLRRHNRMGDTADLDG